MYYVINPVNRKIMKRCNDYEQAADHARQRVARGAENGMTLRLEVVRLERVFSGDHGVVES